MQEIDSKNDIEFMKKYGINLRMDDGNDKKDTLCKNGVYCYRKQCTFVHENGCAGWGNRDAVIRLKKENLKKMKMN